MKHWITYSPTFKDFRIWRKYERSMDCKNQRQEVFRLFLHKPKLLKGGLWIDTRVEDKKEGTWTPATIVDVFLSEEEKRMAMKEPVFLCYKVFQDSGSTKIKEPKNDHDREIFIDGMCYVFQE